MKALRTTKQIGGLEFTLEEHLDNYVEAQSAAATYRAEGWLCRVQRHDRVMLYYIWVGPERKRKVVLLPGEKVKSRRRRRRKLKRVA
jgi:hypothetical protein